ncbi:hypothetical protein BIFGAL_03380 [Bifidobacterium gallicum DSM 20093 = LMG 11596]|uniref:Uncharacterized protein n=1 Tax=Bifidobacterium gallicum DSM 20093 = LMG 11596 TaxID=561180 RepID=D1NU59_9BIFI|nr:hypothetical protein BIFGAL_03380 [Bifidobacterium gallicum DSM 20093 = LMG 11596]
MGWPSGHSTCVFLLCIIISANPHWLATARSPRPAYWCGVAI